MSQQVDWLLGLDPRRADSAQLRAMARALEAENSLELAATAYDLAYGLQLEDAALAAARGALLDRLSVTTHGITFRYVPGGTFLMGGDGSGRAVRLDRYWMAETPISWATYCALMEWESPPAGRPSEIDPRNEEVKRQAFFLNETNKIRQQYCEDDTTEARSGNFHMPGGRIPDGAGGWQHWRYDLKPMIAVGWQEAEDLCARLCAGGRVVRLPSEAEWEKAARGGLIGKRYPWGDEPPDAARCDFDRFGSFAIKPMRQFPPNGYGLYAMSGSVWEWTTDCDAHPGDLGEDWDRPEGDAPEPVRVLRGGSWADCAEAVTVTFRMSRHSSSWRHNSWGGHLVPNVGFRPCLTALSEPPAKRQVRGLSNLLSIFGVGAGGRIGDRGGR
jgi:formylglycine-generating enzyme required for sulfatase activity